MRVFEIPGKPVSWKRARRNGKTYYDSQLKEKEKVKTVVKSYLSTFKASLEPLKLTLEFRMPIPKSWPKKRKEKALGAPHSSRPDLDNLVKFVGDALNDVLWKDDMVICEIAARKIYSPSPKTLLFFEDYRDEMPYLLPTEHLFFDPEMRELYE